LLKVSVDNPLDVSVGLTDDARHWRSEGVILTEGKLLREPKAPFAKIVKQNLTQVPCVDVDIFWHLVLTSQRQEFHAVSARPKKPAAETCLNRETNPQGQQPRSLTSTSPLT
jgi:hypothetical protein